ncbi:hypothetical protein [Bradyrhizobium zhanjiangense]|nr:hypothetical protein [Bradyrhizobium zhanjiangense]
MANRPAPRGTSTSIIIVGVGFDTAIIAAMIAVGVAGAGGPR